MASARPHPAGTRYTATYWFKGPLRVTVQVAQMQVLNVTHRVGISWDQGGQRRHQKPMWPKGWYPTILTETKYTPGAIIWRGRKKPTLVVVADSAVGMMYEVRAPIVYQLSGRRWTLVSIHPEALEFTELGAFYVQADKLHVWDFVGDNRGRIDSHKFRLTVFRLSDGHLHEVERHLTKHFYYSATDGGDPPPEVVPKDKDPLWEFGLRWRWWGERQSS